MALGIKSQITGMDAARAKLREFSKKIERRVTRNAVASGSREFLRGVKSALHAQDTGALRKSLGSKVVVYRGGAVVIGVIGPRTGTVTTGRGAKKKRRLSALAHKLAALGKIPAFYAHLVEGGTRAHALGKGSHVVARINRRTGKLIHPQAQLGRMHPGTKAQPFMRSGYQATEATALARVTQVLADGIEAAAKGA